MKKHKILLALGLYALFLMIGHHGPFALNKDDHHQPHTHAKHVIHLLKKYDDLGQPLKARKFVPLTA